MKVTLERNHLLKSLSHVHRVVERRNTYPILANVLFKASDDRVELRATDLDIEVVETIAADAPEPGATDRARVVEALGPSPVAVDEIMAHTGLHPAQIFMILLELELAGRLERHSGDAVSLL